jgi:hypothetical protein
MFAWMGYRLFKLGYFEKAGELKAAYGSNHLLVKQVAPGVFFAMLGALMVAGPLIWMKPIQISIPAPRTNTASVAADGGYRSSPCGESESITGKGPQKPDGGMREVTEHWRQRPEQPLVHGSQGIDLTYAISHIDETRKTARPRNPHRSGSGAPTPVNVNVPAHRKRKGKTSL